MTQIPAGWYPDPDPDSPEPRGRRYWNGEQWTEHVAAPSGPSGAAYGGVPDAGAPYRAGTAPVTATTPDGQPLAGWWRRVGAYLIDWLVLLVATIALGWTWVRQIGGAYGDLLRETVRATENGAPLPEQGELLADLGVPFLILSSIALVLNFGYNVAFLKWRAATPGKLALGMRVRLREVPGSLSWGTVLTRWLAQNWYSLLGAVPVLGGVLAIYPVIDDLWPLWDPRRQALHDKIAKTNVVRVR